MIKRHFILIFACGCFASCDNNLADNSKKSDIVVKQSNIPVDTNSNKRNSEQIGNPVSVRTNSQILCDDSKGILLDYKKIKKHGVNNPYNMKQKVNGDSTEVSFEIISNCHGEKYTGEAKVVNEVLLLGYYIAKDSVRLADCDCDYRISYFIETKKIEGKEVRIASGKILQ